MSKHILFFFGADIDLMYLDVALKNHGLEVSVARNMDDAIAHLDDHNFDLIIIQDFSDIYMLRAVKGLRKYLTEHRQETPILLVSYSARSQEFIRQAFKAGGNFVYSRHTSLMAIIPKIDGLLESH